MANKFPAHVRHAMGLAANRRTVKPVKSLDDASVLSQHPGKGYCTIFDIGAGDGTKSIQWLLDKDNVLVYAFEPDPRQFAKLIESRNALDAKDKRRIQIFNVAITNTKDNLVDLYVCNDQSSSSILPFVEENTTRWKYPPGRYFFKTIDVIKVPAVRLDDFMIAHSVQHIDFLCIEAQGVANKVLESLGPKKLRHVKEILCKVHAIDFDVYQNQAQEVAVCEYLQKNDFEIVNKENYSRNQERFIRCIHAGWKALGTKIYGFK